MGCIAIRAPMPIGRSRSWLRPNPFPFQSICGLRTDLPPTRSALRRLKI